FKSTLDEVAEADLLLHVADASAPQRDGQMQAVREVLHEIGAHRAPVLVVFNKVDLLTAEDRALLARRHPEAVMISAATEHGLEDLLRTIGEQAARGSVTLSVLVPYTRGELVQLAHERAQIVSESHTPQGTQLLLRVPAELAAAFREFEQSSIE
ncbi:MAG: GTPase HflX, partial [Coriobacteriia bacterium]|nr:GTPase HflX [Coriobacteriia bacterium]